MTVACVLGQVAPRNLGYSFAQVALHSEIADAGPWGVAAGRMTQPRFHPQAIEIPAEGLSSCVKLLLHLTLFHMSDYFQRERSILGMTMTEACRLQVPWAGKVLHISLRTV